MSGNKVQPLHKNLRKQLLDEINEMELWSQHAAYTLMDMRPVTMPQKREHAQTVSRVTAIRRHIVSLMESLGMERETVAREDG